MVKVHGSNFKTTFQLVCSFGDSGAVLSKARFVTSSLVECEVPFSNQLVEDEILKVNLQSGAGIGDVVHNEDDDDSHSLDFVYVESKPHVTSIAPRSGFARALADVGILVSYGGSGEGGDLVSHCFFGNVAVKITSCSKESKSCTCSPPLGGTGDVLVAIGFSAEPTDVSKVGSAIYFTYLAPVTVSSIAPVSGPAYGGSTVTITGSNFVSSSESLRCNFGAYSSSDPPRYLNSTSVTCVVPHNMEPGLYDVNLGTPHTTTTTTTSVVFNAFAPIVISDLAPSSGPTSGGTSISVFGSNFIHTASLMCKFSDTIIPATFVTINQIICISPNHGSLESGVSLSISNNNKDYTSAAMDFVYKIPIKPISMSPLSGPTKGGSAVTVFGENFGSTVGGVQCVFGTVVVEGIVASEQSIQCETPPFATPQTTSFHIISNDGATHYLLNVQQEKVFTFHDEIELFKITPTTKPSNLPQKVVVKGANFLNSPNLVCDFMGSVLVGNWISDSSMSCVLPSGGAVGEGVVRVSNNGKDFDDVGVEFVVTKSSTLAEIYPTVSSDAFGLGQGGETVTVTGENFVHSGSLKCHFGDLLHSEARFVSDKQLQCNVPASTNVVGSGGGSARVEFKLSSEGTFFDETLQFSFVRVSSLVSSISPASGSLGGGTVVTVLLELDGDEEKVVSHCKFGDSVVPATMASANSCSCVSPATPTPGAIQFAVSTNNGETFTRENGSSAKFTYTPDMIVESISPTTGFQAGGTVVTVNALNVVPTTSATCKFGTVVVSARYINSNTYSCVSPANLIPNKHYSVEVSSNSLDYTANEVKFTALSSLTIGSVSPTIKPVNNVASVVTVTGGPFTFTPYLKCRFGNVAVTDATFISSTKVSCETPELSASAVETVPNYLVEQLAISLNGVDYGPSSAEFTFVKNPIVRKISPTKGPHDGGTQVSVSGSSFIVGSDEAWCKFGEEVTSANVVSSTLLTCSTPPSGGISGTVGVQISVNGGVDWSAGGAASFTFTSSLHVSSVRPYRGGFEGGTMVAIFGSNFINSNSLICKFGETIVRAPNVVWVSGSQVNCLTPGNGAGVAPRSVVVQVSNNGGEDLFGAGPSAGGDEIYYTYYGHAIVREINPSTASSVGGTPIVVAGRNFLFGEDTVCRFGHVVVSATYIDDNTIECLTPPKGLLHGETSAISFEVSNNNKDFSNSNTTYEYVDAPAIASFAPSTGSIRGGDVLSFSGDGLTSTGSVWCRFQNQMGGDANPHTVEGVVTVSGSAECAVPNRMSTSTKHSFNKDRTTVLVELSTNNYDFSTSNSMFTFQSRSRVTRVFPLDGSVLGGTVVAISGVNFAMSSSSSLSCKFGSQVVAATYVSESEIWCTAPEIIVKSNDDYSVAISVGDNKRDFVQSGFKFNYMLPGTISAISPTNGRSEGGTLLKVFGTNFVQTQHMSCR